MKSFEFDDESREIDENEDESMVLESFNEDVYDKDTDDDDAIDEVECFCFNCEQTVDPEEDLKECENCGLYFYVCTECKEDILADDNMCFRCQEEEFL